MDNSTELIGITGGIGSGKSTIARLFSELGLPTIDSDEIARAALEKGAPGYQPAIDCFGDEILAADGAIDRRELASLVFSDDSKRRALEAILHPIVREKIRMSSDALAQAGHRFIVVEVPLLFEAGWEAGFDAVIAVSCDEEIAIARAMQRLSISRDDARARIAAQAPAAEKVARADAAIDNSGDLDEARAQVKKLFAVMKSGNFPRK